MKKTFYIFLTAILGALLVFTIMASLAILLQARGYDYSSLSIGEIMAGLAIVEILGLLYGTWLGGRWYAWVYEGGRQKISSISATERTSLRAKLDSWEVEDLMTRHVTVAAAPKRVRRTPAPAARGPRKKVSTKL